MDTLFARLLDFKVGMSILCNKRLLSDSILYDKWLVYNSILCDERQPRKHDSISYTMSVWYFYAIFVDEDNEEYVEIIINK